MIRNMMQGPVLQPFEDNHVLIAVGGLLKQRLIVFFNKAVNDLRQSCCSFLANASSLRNMPPRSRQACHRK